MKRVKQLQKQEEESKEVVVEDGWVATEGGDSKKGAAGASAALDIDEMHDIDADEVGGAQEEVAAMDIDDMDKV